MEEQADKPKWYKNKYFIIFVSIILFAIAIRFYYFLITMNQPLWWDEAEYMATAKTYAGKAMYELTSQRLPGFPMLMSSFFFLGIDNEAVMRFIALFLPSIIVLILIYLAINEMYPDKRIALISVSIMAVLWEHLFYSNRFHTENFALIFELLAFIVLFRSYVKKQNSWFIKPKYSLPFISIFSIIAVIFRPGNIPFIPAIILFIIILNKSKSFSGNAKYFSMGVIILILIAAIAFLSAMPQSGLLSYWHPENPVSLNLLSVFYGFYQSTVPLIPSVLYYFFLFGILILFIDFAINFSKLKSIENNQENLGIKSDLFNILLIFSVLFIFIFMVRPPAFEYRWFFPLLTGMLAFTGKGLVTFSEYVGKAIKSGAAVTILIIIILGLGMYTQYVHADMIIKEKIGSYAEVKDAALWMKEHSDKNDIIFSISKTQTAYYSERRTISYSLMNNGSEFDGLIEKYEPKYLTVSIFEPHPDWIFSWVDENNASIQPVRIYYTDKTNQQASLAVYGFKS